MVVVFHVRIVGGVLLVFHRIWGLVNPCLRKAYVNPCSVLHMIPPGTGVGGGECGIEFDSERNWFENCFNSILIPTHQAQKYFSNGLGVFYSPTAVVNRYSTHRLDWSVCCAVYPSS